MTRGPNWGHAPYEQELAAGGDHGWTRIPVSPPGDVRPDPSRALIGGPSDSLRSEPQHHATHIALVSGYRAREFQGHGKAASLGDRGGFVRARSPTTGPRTGCRSSRSVAARAIQACRAALLSRATCERTWLGAAVACGLASGRAMRRSPLRHSGQPSRRQLGKRKHGCPPPRAHALPERPGRHRRRPHTGIIQPRVTPITARGHARGSVAACAVSTMRWRRHSPAGVWRASLYRAASASPTRSTGWRGSRWTAGTAARRRLTRIGKSLDLKTAARAASVETMPRPPPLSQPRAGGPWAAAGSQVRGPGRRAPPRVSPARRPPS